MCSHLFSVAMAEHSDQKQIREERVYLAYTPGQSVTEKSWGRNSGRALGGMLLIGSVSFFEIESRLIYLGMTLLTVDQTLPHQSRQSVTDMRPGQSV